MEDHDDLRDDMGRDNLGKIWWTITVAIAFLFWFLASYVLYLFWYEDDYPAPRTFFNPLTNLANFLVGLLIAWLIMLPFRPRVDL